MSDDSSRLDIFEVLRMMDTKDNCFLQRLPEEDQKKFQPLVVQKWMSGTGSALQIILIDELVNPYVFELGEHKRLLWKLLTVCTSGKPRKYQWIKQQKHKNAAKKLSAVVVSEYFNYTTNQAYDVLDVFTSDQIVDLAEQLGRQPDEMSKISKEWK